MPYKLYKSLSGLYIPFICLYVSAQEPTGLNWNMVKSQNNIDVYTASKTTSAFKYIKVDALLSGTLDKFVAVFQDVPDQSKWVYNTKRAYVIKKFDANDLLYYNETALPWPVSNRDAAIHMKIVENKTGNEVVVQTTGEPKAIPENTKLVRVPHFVGTWKAREIGGGKLQVRYFLDIEPGGSMPAWIVNLFVTKGPYETFKQLVQRLKP